MKRSAVALTASALILAGCATSTSTTEPAVADTFSVAGAWTGCLTEPGVQCSAVSMTLADSSLTDSTASVSGTGNWGVNVAITGMLNNALLTMNATSPGVLQAWNFSGTLSGNTLAGTMTLPNNGPAYQVVFTR